MGKAKSNLQSNPAALLEKQASTCSPDHGGAHSNIMSTIHDRAGGKFERNFPTKTIKANISKYTIDKGKTDNGELTKPIEAEGVTNAIKGNQGG